MLYLICSTGSSFDTPLNIIQFFIIINSIFVTDVLQNLLPQVSVQTKLWYVDRSRFDLHITEQVRQQYILSCKEDYTSQGVFIIKYILLCVYIDICNLNLH